MRKRKSFRSWLRDNLATFLGGRHGAAHACWLETFGFKGCEVQHFLAQFPVMVAFQRGPEHRFEYVNPRCLEWLGRDVTGFSARKAFTEPERALYFSHLDDAYRSGRAYFAHERPVLMPDGRQLRYLTFAFQPMRGSDGQVTGILTLALDVTDSVRARMATEQSRAEIQAYVNQLQEERDLRERFVATLTHDLQNPLFAAKMTSELMLKKVGDPSTCQQLVPGLVREIGRAVRMIGDLLDANQIRAGQKLPLHVEKCDLNEVIEELLREWRDAYPNVRIEKSISSSVGYWDPLNLQRAVENLCTNAMKYGLPEQGIRITAKGTPETIEISVNNRGKPLSFEEQRQIFLPFSRTETAKGSGKRGWGIGLTLVRGVAEAHGGTVRVESDAEHGTTFTLTLPRDARSFAHPSPVKAA